MSKHKESSLVFDFALFCAAIWVFIILITPKTVVDACSYYIEYSVDSLGQTVLSVNNPTKAVEFEVKVPIIKFRNAQEFTSELRPWINIFDSSGASIYFPRDSLDRHDALQSGVLLRLRSLYGGCEWIFFRSNVK